MAAIVIFIQGVYGGRDLSPFLDREGAFEIEGAVGKRVDTLHMSLFDPHGVLAIPDRAEVIIYDYPASSLPPGWAHALGGGTPIVDPPPATVSHVGVVTNWDGGGAWDGDAFWDASPTYTTLGNSQNWTPRLFAGYVATASYTPLGAGQRSLEVHAQDYTFLLKATECNKAYQGGRTDDFIIRDILGNFAPELDTSNVATLVWNMPLITFPMHTLEQFLSRITQLSRGVYRVDYFKRFFYDVAGGSTTLLAPFVFTDQPNP